MYGVLLTTYECYMIYICQDKQLSSMASHRSIRTCGQGRELRLVFAHHPEGKQAPRKKTGTRLDKCSGLSKSLYGLGMSGVLENRAESSTNMSNMLECNVAARCSVYFAKLLCTFLFFEPPPGDQSMARLCAYRIQKG